MQCFGIRTLTLKFRKTCKRVLCFFQSVRLIQFYLFSVAVSPTVLPPSTTSFPGRPAPTFRPHSPTLTANHNANPTLTSDTKIFKRKSGMSGASRNAGGHFLRPTPGIFIPSCFTYQLPFTLLLVLVLHFRVLFFQLAPFYFTLS